MKYYLKTIKFIILICIIILFISCGSQTSETSGIYTYQIEDYNGIGKWYMGREIASVMGFEGMEWLERPEREFEENVSTLINNMSINLEDTIADIGAGSGYHTFRMALKAPKGFIYAIDIQEEMLSEISSRINNGYLKNIAPILGTETNINLIENSVDKILLVDVYHEFKYPFEMMKSIKNNYRFKKFYNKLQELGITRELKDNIDTWSYENLNEAGRIASLVKSKMKSNGII